MTARTLAVFILCALIPGPVLAESDVPEIVDDPVDATIILGTPPFSPQTSSPFTNIVTADFLEDDRGFTIVVDLLAFSLDYPAQFVAGGQLEGKTAAFFLENFDGTPHLRTLRCTPACAWGEGTFSTDEASATITMTMPWASLPDATPGARITRTTASAWTFIERQQSVLNDRAPNSVTTLTLDERIWSIEDRYGEDFVFERGTRG